MTKEEHIKCLQKSIESLKAEIKEKEDKVLRVKHHLNEMRKHLGAQLSKGYTTDYAKGYESAATFTIETITLIENEEFPTETELHTGESKNA